MEYFGRAPKKAVSHEAISTMTSVLEAKLWPRIDTPGSNQNFWTDPRHRGCFAGQSLLYDSLVIPTSDFGIVPIALQWIGLSSFRQALDEGDLQFVRYRSWLGYAGNGDGVIAFHIVPGGAARSFAWWQEAIWGESQDSIELQLRHAVQALLDHERRALVRAILSASKDFEVERSVFERDVAEETYKDIAGDRNLVTQIRQQCNAQRAVDLRRLPGVEPNQVRYYSHDEPRDAIGSVLRAAELNIELLLSASQANCDLSTFEEAGATLQRKIERKLPINALAGFQRILELHGLPDIPAAIEASQIEIGDIWAVRGTKAARKFRNWLAAADLYDGRDLVRQYVESLGGESRVSSLPGRTLRWILTSGVGFLASMHPGGLAGLLAGTAVSGLDGLFVDKWFAGYSPRLFINELKQLRFEPPPLSMTTYRDGRSVDRF
jgi:hypothetical protein